MNLFYNNKEGNYYEKIDDDDANESMILCNKQTDVKCFTTESYGYYYITNNDDSQNLLFCEDKEYSNSSVYSCETIDNLENGYYINHSNDDVAKCIDNTCEIFSAGTNCNNNKNEVIISNNKKYYCHDTNQIFFNDNDSDRYYKLENVNASDLYPNISNGNDIILIKMSPYSVTQFIRNDGESK